MTDMNYRGTSRSHQSEIDEKRKKRLTQVREQCKEIAQQVRIKVKCEKQNQLKKIQEIKHQELNQWKKRKQIATHQECDINLREFGAAHIAACETSCEDDGSLGQRREEFEILAAERGRYAMQHEQKKRDRETEDRLAKRKQKYQKNAGVQTNFITKSAPAPSILWQEELNDVCSSEEEGARVQNFSIKRNIHKSTESHYNPKNYTSNSIDSSNNFDSEGTNESISPEEESEVEFNQISNLLKQKCFDFENIQSLRIEQPESPEEDNQKCKDNHRQSKAANLNRKKTTETLSKKKVTIKSPKKYQQQSETHDSSKKQKVTYVDYGNKFTKFYSPDNELVKEIKSTTNARIDAKNEEIDCLKGFKDETLRQLSEARHNEALEKQKIRRDYDRLRFQLDEIAQEEQKARESSGLAVGLSKFQSEKQKIAKTSRMNEAVEKSLKHNILTCQPVDSSKLDLPPSKKSDEVNVHNNGASQLESSNIQTNKNTEVHDMVKLERLRNLLERINRQKKIILDKIEYEEIVGDDNIDAVLRSFEKISETATAKKEQTSEDVCKNAELLSREMKLKEREKQLEQMIKDLYRKQKDLNAKNSKPQTSSNDSNTFEVVPPVEIIIKVKKPGVKKNFVADSDALTVQAKKLYPKTPKKSSSKEQIRKVAEPAETAVHPKMVQEQTQTSPTGSERLKPILKKTESSIASSRCDDSSQSVSTSYQSLPDKINPSNSANKRHHKLNPALMHYIARLLGMNKNLGNQLSVEVSAVETPSSSVINTSGNNESSSSSQTPSFDNKRLQKLQEFISQNYSFLSEINETLERSQIQEPVETNIQKVEDIWRDNLRSKKSSTSSKQTKISKQSEIRHPPPQAAQLPLPRNHMQPPKTATQLSKKPQQTLQPQISRVEPESRPRRQTPITSSDMMNVAENLGSHMLNNYEEYTANCQKRIEGMTQMLEQIRLEKLKLIENSLSSTEFGHHTEYKDIAFPDKTQYAPTTSASDAKETQSQREDPPSEEINSILQKQTRPFGVSKDSGISMLSRPVTSSDFRDSPDTRMTSEERENTFQPILKDIPKPTKIKVTATDGSSQTIKDMSQVIREIAELKIQKNLKPPVSLNRLSPHLEKPHEAHELSTIVEVETPSASKVNLIGADAGERAAIAPFISYEEYASKLPANQQDLTNASQHASMTVLEQINLKSFKQPHDFGIQELSNEGECLSNGSSIIDIMEELKNRHLIDVPFQNLETIKMRHLEAPKGSACDNEADLRKKPPSTQETSESESNGTLSGIQEIEKEGLDLPGMGLSWAAAMLKRAGESKKNQSSNSNSSDERQKSISIEIQFSRSDHSSPVTSGQPLNLRDFLTRELTKKSPSDDSLSLDNESSLSSQFMRSLLNATAKSSSGNKSPSQSSDDRLRTSTPVQAKGNNQNQTTKSTNTQAFLGESLSTVKSSDDDAAGRKS